LCLLSTYKAYFDRKRSKLQNGCPKNWTTIGQKLQKRGELNALQLSSDNFNLYSMNEIIGAKVVIIF